MARTDLKDSQPTGRRVADFRDRMHYLRFFAFVALFLSCALLTATSSKAQDVADAARQERARKASQQKPPKHIYTEEDLRRSHILTPEDSEQMEAKRQGQIPLAVEKPSELIDAQSSAPQIPLGDIARQYRKLKLPRQPQQIVEFHLPFSNPSLATPVRPVQPIRPLSNRKDPFLRPPALRRSLPLPTVAFSPVPAPPAVISPRSVASFSHPSNPTLHVVTVRRGDSLWKIAQQNLGKGLRWPELLAVNPRIVNPNQIEAGARIYVPSQPAVRPGASKIKARRGDTLWKIARMTFGRGSFWPCLALANPLLRDANHIQIGQELVIPGRCGPPAAPAAMAPASLARR